MLFLGKRLLHAGLILLGVTLICYLLLFMLPADPARQIAGRSATPEVVENIRHQLGLDLPLYQQYGRYVLDLVQGDLGTSIRTNRPVLEDLQAFFPATLELALVALFLAILVGVPLGVPGILSAAVLGFLEAWNAIEQPMTFLKTKALWPLSLYLPQIAAEKLGLAMVASLVMLAPAVLIFRFGQKYLELGIQASGLKE